ncbi:hypothetical protein ABLT31_02200 [Ammoniphilus sp. 3BR4]
MDIPNTRMRYIHWNGPFFFSRKKRAEQQTVQMMQSFANELVSENQRLMQTMIEMNKKTEDKIAQLQWGLKQLENRMALLEEQPLMPDESLATSEGGLALGHSTQEAARTSQDILHLRNRYKEVFDLCNQGYTIEEISKELGYGKGELELILQLAGHR